MRLDSRQELGQPGLRYLGQSRWEGRHYPRELSQSRRSQVWQLTRPCQARILVHKCSKVMSKCLFRLAHPRVECDEAITVSCLILTRGPAPPAELNVGLPPRQSSILVLLIRMRLQIRSDRHYDVVAPSAHLPLSALPGQCDAECHGVGPAIRQRLHRRPASRHHSGGAASSDKGVGSRSLHRGSGQPSHVVSATLWWVLNSSTRATGVRTCRALARLLAW